MPKKNQSPPCIVCNPDGAEPGDYCDSHRDELHRLDHQYETLFRMQRTSRGKDHETYNVFLQGECNPCGRILVTETDPEHLAITVLLSNDVNLDARLAEYDSLKVVKTYGNQLRERIEQEIIHSWYGNARACVDIIRTTAEKPEHWDVEPRGESAEEEAAELDPPQGGKHSVH
jgi:hypothetical protein